MSRLAPMPSRGPHPALAAVLLLLGASLLAAGCGDNGTNPELLPESQSDYLLSNLDEAEAAFEDDDCETALAHIEAVQERVNDLGKPISRELKINLREGAATLREQVEVECAEADQPEPAPEPEPEPVPEPEPEPETPEPQPDSPDEEEPTPDEETPPDQPEPAPEPEPQPEPAPEPTPPTPQPEPTPTPPSGGVGPADEAGGP